MLLRFIAISLLVLIALRLLGRLMAALMGDRSAGSPRAQPGHATSRPEHRLLEPCPHCGTYFDPERSLTAPQSRRMRFCSPACLEAHAIEGTSTTDPSSQTKTGDGPPS